MTFDELPEFPGWRKVGWEEEIFANHLMVCVAPKTPRHLELNTPEKCLAEKKFVKGNAGTLAGVFHHAYPHWYIYAKAPTYRGKPDGIKAKPGWFPIPDDELFIEGDVWFYTYPTAGEPVAKNNYGKSIETGWLGIKLIAWPYRKNANWVGGGAPEVRRRYENPAQLKEPLPLP